MMTMTFGYDVTEVFAVASERAALASIITEFARCMWHCRIEQHGALHKVP